MANTKNLNLTQVRRISLLLAYLKRNPYQNKQAILDYFEDNDKGFNERTLYRLNETLSRDFGIEIVFDYNNDGYYFDEEKISRINLHTKIFTLNIEVLQANQPHIIEDDSILTYDELLSKQEAKVISTIIDEPEFLGTIDKQFDSSYLFDKLNKKEL